MTYPMTIAGIKRELPLCKVADDFYIGAFIMFGDAEITVACAKELLARAPKEYDYLLTRWRVSPAQANILSRARA